MDKQNDSSDTLTLNGGEMAALLETVQDHGADFRFTARGGSMRPTIRDGDTVTVSPLAGIPPMVGEVAAFKHPHSGRLFVHRVIERTEDGVETRGDNLNIPDPPVPSRSVLGVVSGVERNGRSRSWPKRGSDRWSRLRLHQILIRINWRRRLKRIWQSVKS